MNSRNPFFRLLTDGNLKEQPGYVHFFFLLYLTFLCPARTHLAVSQIFLSSFVYCADKSRLDTVWFYISFSTRALFTSVLDMLVFSVRLSSWRFVRSFSNHVNHFPSFCTLVLPPIWTAISGREFC